MNWKTFLAVLRRDGTITIRNLTPILLQVLLQPLLFVFVFGRVLVSSGMMRPGYKSVLLPGIIAISMVISGIQGVTTVLIGEIHFSHEIEDRLLAPMETYWLGVEKIVIGALKALFSGLVVIPAAWLIIGGGAQLDFSRPFEFAIIALLVATMAAAGGMALGCSFDPAYVSVLFSLIVTPLMMFGCAYYPWSALAKFPVVQYAVLLNPVVYASESLRAVLAPQAPHMPLLASVGALVGIDLLLILVGLRKFLSVTVK